MYKEHITTAISKLLNEAVAQDIIRGYQNADGWVILYFEDNDIKLSEGHVVPFLRGMLYGCQHVNSQTGGLDA